jgi:hypothetical protein
MISVMCLASFIFCDCVNFIVALDVSSMLFFVLKQKIRYQYMSVQEIVHAQYSTQHKYHSSSCSHVERLVHSCDVIFKIHLFSCGTIGSLP